MLNPKKMIFYRYWDPKRISQRVSGSIAAEVEEAESIQSPRQQKSHKFSKQIGLVVLAASILLFLIGVVIGENLEEMFMAAVRRFRSVTQERIESSPSIEEQSLTRKSKIIFAHEIWYDKQKLKFWQINILPGKILEAFRILSKKLPTRKKRTGEFSTVSFGRQRIGHRSSGSVLYAAQCSVLSPKKGMRADAGTAGPNGFFKSSGMILSSNSDRGIGSVHDRSDRRAWRTGL
jgi:hypothetical protein